MFIVIINTLKCWIWKLQLCVVSTLQSMFWNQVSLIASLNSFLINFWIILIWYLKRVNSSYFFFEEKRAKCPPWIYKGHLAAYHRSNGQIQPSLRLRNKELIYNSRPYVFHRWLLPRIIWNCSAGKITPAFFPVCISTW